MRDVAIIGLGITKWGELWDKSLRDLYSESAMLAIKDAGVDHIDSMYIGSMSPGLFVQQEHIASLMSDYMGMKNLPATRVESACASGGLALKSAVIEVASGMSDVVLAGGVEKMTDCSGDHATMALATAADAEYESYQGITFPGLYAMIAKAHMEKYGTTREQLAMVSVKNHKNGLLNPNAQYHLDLSVDAVLSSVMVADPLRILDCSPITDGAAAVIVAGGDALKNFKKHKPIHITGIGHSTDTIALHSRKDLTSLDAVKNSAEKAYKMSGKSPNDINVTEVHDCFSIAEICVSEALGYFEKGQGGKAVEEGKTAMNGKKPINTSGGLKSKGHPVGATGIAQAIEVAEQLRGTAGKRQIKDAKVGLTQNMGGSGGSSIVHIMEVK